MQLSISDALWPVVSGSALNFNVSEAQLALGDGADLQIWRPLCRKNFNFLLKMKGMWAEPAELQLIK